LRVHRTHFDGRVVLVLALIVAACNGGDAATTSTDPSPSTAPSTTGAAAPGSSTAEPPDLPTHTQVPYITVVYPPPSWTVIDDGVWVSEGPVWRDPARYAGAVGITIEEAERRNLMTEEALVLLERPLTDWLDGLPGWQLQRRFAGVWVEEDQDGWWLMAALTPGSIDPQEIAEGLVAGTGLEGLLFTVEAEFSMLELDRDLRAAYQATNTCAYYDHRVEIDELSNRVLVRVHSMDDFHETRTDQKVGAIPSAVIIEEPRNGTPNPPGRCRRWCPCVGCRIEVTVTAGETQVAATLHSAMYLGCHTPDTPTTALTLDNVPSGAAIDRMEVLPGRVLTVTVTPQHPEMKVRIVPFVEIDLGDGAWRITAPDQPGEYRLDVLTEAPRGRAYHVLTLVVTEDDGI
jgi:hypothetical protein